MNTTTKSLIWHLFPCIVVRTTGFPYDLVEHLRAPEMLSLAKQVYHAQAKLQELREKAPRLHSSDRKLRARFHAGQPFPENLEGDKNWLDRWNDLARQAK